MRKLPRVLIVEDEPAIAELIAVNLRHNGFQPFWAEDGDSAQRDRLLQRALRFAGRRSLLEEYMAAVLEVARYHPGGAPVADLIQSVLEYVQSINLEAAVQLLQTPVAPAAVPV